MEGLLDKPGNIWETCRYINENPNQAGFASISSPQTTSGTTSSNSEIAQEFLRSFFLPLPVYLPVTTSSSDIHPHELLMIPISKKEIAKAVFSTSPFKGAGSDSIPTIVWQKLWPIIQDKIVKLSTASVHLGVMPEQWKTARIIPLRKP